MNLQQVAEQLTQLILNKYGTFYKASKETGLARIYFSNLSKHPTSSNVIRIAKSCGYEIALTIKEDNHEKSNL